VLQQRDQLPCAAWFADTRLNFAEHQLARDDDAAALNFRNERGLRRELSLAGLRRELAR